jgi:hypothetical protein
VEVSVGPCPSGAGSIATKLKKRDLKSEGMEKEVKPGKLGRKVKLSYFWMGIL